MSPPAPGLRPASPSSLLGEIIAWSCPGISVRHLHLIEALRDSGLDESVARELAPRHAFKRACRLLAERRIIRQAAEDEQAITFQFTAEQRDGDRFTYELETMLEVNKRTGRVACDRPALAAKAQDELDRCIEARTGSDVTRVVQKLFDRHADLFPIRPGGGAYFVPRSHSGFTDKIQSFLSRINGGLYRFPVPAGTADGDRSVKEAVAEGLRAMVAEHAAAVASFGDDTRPDTLERAADRIRITRFKLQAYDEYLAEQRSSLERALAETTLTLRQRVGGLSASVA